ncbi:retrovirus-related Pol polyprotein from transposon 412 [Trichonephila clavipes]|nr:retrovirus-related Pol polyprotein from transposon 412 [Trichonephila clavipes]
MDLPTHSFTSDRNCGDSSERTFREKQRLPPHKNLLLARFQLTPIALRDRFESHQRRPGAMWADLVFELRSYLDNWLAGMKVDSWDGFKEAKSLAEKLDHFEAIRRVHKKTGPTKTWERRTFDKQPLESKNKLVKEKRRTKRSLNLGIPPPSEGGEDDSFIIPAFEGEREKSLAKVKGVEFKEEQRKCPDLKPLWDKALTGIDKEFRVIRGKLVRVAKTKRGEEVRQLYVPIKFRLDINKLSHDEIGGHLRVTKTKDRILRHFFWPNVYRDVEEFVKICDSCQRVGKPRDKAKAPLKLVPIISEVFSKINIDAVGPLPVSTKQNRYLITSICVASKYPEAIPVESITSPNVIDALLSIFSRIGFPREIQSDLETSFTSELTTTFFNKFGIKVRRSSVSHPQSIEVERVHRTIKRVIKALCVESGEDWEEVLPLALFSLRTSVQVSVPPSWSWERI